MPARVDLSRRKRRARVGSKLWLLRVRRLRPVGFSDSEASDMAVVPLKNRAVIAAMRLRKREIRDLMETFGLTHEEAKRRAISMAYIRHETYPGSILSAMLNEASEEYGLT